MTWLLILGFTISSSLDNFGVGISYGIRKIQIGFIPNLLIAVVCFLFSYSGVRFGIWISEAIPGVLPERIGACVLLLIGFHVIRLAFSNGEKKSELSESNSKSITAILKNPELADLDKSNDIGILESLILGAALSTNAMTNGLSAGLFEISPLLLSLAAAVGSFLCVWLGIWLGGKAADLHIGSFSLGQVGTLASGIILLLIAVNFFF